MKCYFCKKTIAIAVKTFVSSRKPREYDKYRDLCEPCYFIFMESKGYKYDTTEKM